MKTINILIFHAYKVTAINDPAVDIDYICYLIKFDSTHGKFKGQVTSTVKGIIVNGNNIFK